jgi:hypothetical protein
MITIDPATIKLAVKAAMFGERRYKFQVQCLGLHLGTSNRKWHHAFFNSSGR